MKSKKLETARQPNGCHYTKLRTLFESFPETNSQNSCSLNYGTQKGRWEIKIYRNGKKKCYGNCAEVSVRGSRQKQSVWCNICGWVHFKCSGLQQVKNYKREAEFLCLKCCDAKTC